MILRLCMVATVLAASIPFSTPSLAQSARTLPAGTCRAIDGDTLRCGSLRIRLLGIDAAELAGHCARGRRCAGGDPIAQWNTLARLARGPLRISPVDKDTYGRIVAQVSNDAGKDLSCAMLAAGATYKPRWDNGQRIARTCPSLAQD